MSSVFVFNGSFINESKNWLLRTTIFSFHLHFLKNFSLRALTTQTSQNSGFWPQKPEINSMEHLKNISHYFFLSFIFGNSTRHTQIQEFPLFSYKHRWKDSGLNTGMGSPKVRNHFFQNGAYRILKTTYKFHNELVESLFQLGIVKIWGPFLNSLCQKYSLNIVLMWW